MPQPTPVPILTNSRSSTRAGQPGVHLAERHDVHVVVDQHRAAEVLRRAPTRTGYWSQPGMIGGATGTPSRNDTGPGTPTPAPCRSTALAVGAQLADQVEDHGEDGVRAARGRPSARLTCSSTFSSAVGDGDVDRGGADVDAEEAQAARPGRRSPTGGRRGTRRGPRDSTRPISVSRSSSTASFDRERWTASPSSARLIGPSSRSSRSSVAWWAFSGSHRHSPHATRLAVPFL